MDLPSVPANSRVYVGGLGEQATRQDMEELLKDFGPYQDFNLLRGYGFVQFTSEESARMTITGLNGKMHKGRKLTVKIANDNRAKKGLLPRGAGAAGAVGAVGIADVGGRDRSPIDGNRYAGAYPPGGVYRGMYPGMEMTGYNDQMMGGHQMPPAQPESNDCEIIVVSRDLTTYAENIESRLKRNGLSVDLLFPNDDVPIGKVLSNIASRGSYYAILITPENEERHSITVNVLYGIPAEHRNMPTEDAIMFICKDFEERLRSEQEKMVNYRNVMPAGPHMAPVTGNTHMKYNAPPLQDIHPEPIQNMINLLASNRQLTVLQYERLIKYLTERKEMQIKYELGEDVDSSSVANKLMPTKSKEENEKELQRKILDILNKPSIVPPKANAVPERESRNLAGGFSSFAGITVGAAGASSSGSSSTAPFANTPIASAAPKLLHDPKVQKALDSLLLSGIGGGGLKF
ncbi:nuclear receptor coactivator 5 [Toxorhynchites rutilus septentrionalis]|uniref:nuclear receptor coactivator 5 n=1 Tax=Toxorhynchites rutilus septentrionalis TaxID=329112 RepID=UPI0024792597|nr:nuclear receptor coactivator 5 [Toxorhynchites rutilus septentrionalis]